MPAVAGSVAMEAAVTGLSYDRYTNHGKLRAELVHAGRERLFHELTFLWERQDREVRRLTAPVDTHVGESSKQGKRRPRGK